MREIKFRAWDLAIKRLGLVDCLVWGESGQITANIVYVDEQVTTTYPELMQFTNLIDKNGKEIYEGDIIKRSLIDFNYSKSFVVAWDSRNACFRLENGPALFHDDNDEIIGNIYENPELLKETE